MASTQANMKLCSNYAVYTNRRAGSEPESCLRFRHSVTITDFRPGFRRGSLNKDISGCHTSTGGEAYHLLIFLDADKFVLLSIFSLTETNCQKRWENFLPSNTNGHFRLTCIAQKRPCLSCLIGTLRSDNGDVHENLAEK